MRDAATDDVLAALAEAERLLVQQLFRPIGNEYRISIPSAGDEEGRTLLHVRQAKLKIREDIRFRTSPDASGHAFRIASRAVFEFAARHDVLDADDQPLGLLQKDFRRSLLRSHWHVYDAAGEKLLEAQERSLLVAVVRRAAGLVSDWVAGLQWLPFHFTLTRPDGTAAGEYRRVLGKLRDRYVLELTPAAADVDRRLLVALAVALDALQDR